MNALKNSLDKIKFILGVIFLTCFCSYGIEIEISAKNSMQKAKESLSKAEELLNTIPSDSEQYKYIVNLIKKAKDDWDIALDAYNQLIDARYKFHKLNHLLSNHVDQEKYNMNLPEMWEKEELKYYNDFKNFDKYN